MAQFPCLPLWTDAWIADTHTLDRAERGLYMDLLILMWRSPGCSVPNDDAWLTAHLHLKDGELDLLHRIINEFCYLDPAMRARICQKRLKREFVERFQFSRRQSERAKARWRKKKHPYDPAYADNGNASLNPSTKQNKASSPSGENQQPPPQTTQQEPTGEQAGYSAPDGAPARSPPPEPTPTKNPQDLSLKEINARWRWRGPFT